MQEGKFYRISFDQPEHDVTVLVKQAKPAVWEIVKVHSGQSWSVGAEIRDLSYIWLNRLEEVGPIVRDGEYLGKDNQTYHRIDGKWYSAIANNTEDTDSLVGQTLFKV